MVGITSLLLLACAGFCNAQSSGFNDCDVWNFDDSSPLGPSNWYTFCPTCSSGSQSPIDIPSDSTIAAQDSQLVTNQLKITTATVSTIKVYNLTNSGDSLVLKFVPKLISITGAGLSGTYYADHLDWHWGNTSDHGSEHSVNGKRYAMEGHIVAYHSYYDSLDDAIGNEDAVAVFAILYHEQAATAPSPYTAIFSVDNLYKVSTPFAFTPLFAFDINYLLPFNIYPFYRYMGSLTTPACTEGIIWTVFSEPVEISSSQMEILRTFLWYHAADNSTGSPLVNNYRPTQPLNGRAVHLVDPHRIEEVASTSTSSSLSFSSSSSSSRLIQMTVLTLLIAPLSRFLSV